MKQTIATLISGILFGFGLGLSQMVDRDRVLGFLDVTGNWDPTLLFVLGGAVGVTLISFRLILRSSYPLFASRFELPTKKDVDLPLILGAAIFGIGWGISGYCPGPALTALVLGILNPILFLISFILGSLGCQVYLSRNVNR
ncbi:MAG: YeeE/YedE family protein [Gloeocapsa sp. DLM2.Bin57]|nr:MAG: YeeE/YedE family protein [Gloeocapsa sp. DLM2.Bin57]